jgi:hypothetical protein
VVVGGGGGGQFGLGPFPGLQYPGRQKEAWKSKGSLGWMAPPKPRSSCAGGSPLFFLQCGVACCVVLGAVVWCGVVLCCAVLCWAVSGCAVCAVLSLFLFVVLGWFGTLKEGEKV